MLCVMGYTRAVWVKIQIKDHCTYHEKEQEAGSLDGAHQSRKEELVLPRWTWNPVTSPLPNKENMQDASWWDAIITKCLRNFFRIPTLEAFSIPYLWQGVVRVLVSKHWGLNFWEWQSGPQSPSPRTGDPGRAAGRSPSIRVPKH